jgi:hypothetical protein
MYQSQEGERNLGEMKTGARQFCRLEAACQSSRSRAAHDGDQFGLGSANWDMVDISRVSVLGSALRQAALTRRADVWAVSAVLEPPGALAKAGPGILAGGAACLAAPVAGVVCRLGASAAPLTGSRGGWQARIQRHRSISRI